MINPKELKNIPKNWVVAPLKRYLYVKSGEMISAIEEVSEGYPIIGGNGVRGYTTKFNTIGPALVIGRVGANCGNTHLILENFWASEHAFVVFQHKNINLEFIEFMIESLDLNSQAIRTAQPLLNTTLVEETLGIFPPEAIQIRIADFIKKEIEKANNLISNKEELILLLSEKRQTLITQTVTKGLNSCDKMKDSGIAWLGDVPEHWIVERTRWLFKERNERSETGDEEMLSVSHITGVTPRSEKNVTMFEAESNEGYKKCFSGDLVINTLWAWMGAMGIAPIEGIVSPAYHVYIPTSAILPEFIDAIVRLPIFATEVTRYSKGVWSSRLRLYPEGFYEVYLPVPPLDEQEQIVKFIKDETEKIDRLKIVTEKSIELLKERRTALITAAVTGQIEIPTEV